MCLVSDPAGRRTRWGHRCSFIRAQAPSWNDERWRNMWPRPDWATGRRLRVLVSCVRAPRRVLPRSSLHPPTHVQSHRSRPPNKMVEHIHLGAWSLPVNRSRSTDTQRCPVRREGFTSWTPLPDTEEPASEGPRSWTRRDGGRIGASLDGAMLRGDWSPLRMRRAKFRCPKGREAGVCYHVRQEGSWVLKLKEENHGREVVRL